MSDLASEKCVPCGPGTAPLRGSELAALAAKLPLWSVVNEHHLQREYRFKNFAHALIFVNSAGIVAEEQNHHPEITFTWGRATVRVWTHSIDGLARGDFVLAAKIERLYETTARE